MNRNRARTYFVTKLTKESLIISQHYYVEPKVKQTRGPSLTKFRMEKIKFFANEARSSKDKYGDPGSDEWVKGLVEYFNCPNITQDVVKYWVDKNPSIVVHETKNVQKVQCSGPLTRSRTSPAPTSLNIENPKAPDKLCKKLGPLN